MAATKRPARAAKVPPQPSLYPLPEALHRTGPASLPEIVREHLAETPLDLDRILRSIVEVHGLASVLESIGELFGDAGKTE